MINKSRCKSPFRNSCSGCRGFIMQKLPLNESITIHMKISAGLNYLLHSFIITLFWKSLIFFLCLSFIFLLIIRKAQNNFDYFSTTRLTQDDGLSQGPNYFRFEDRHGFMWITGNDALNRYDGSTVKVYNLRYHFKNFPALQQGYGFAEDGCYLYIGSTRGLYRYEYERDQFGLIEIFAGERT